MYGAGDRRRHTLRRAKSNRSRGSGRADLKAAASRPLRLAFCATSSWIVAGSSATGPGGGSLYLQGHVPGASFLDVDDDLSDLSRQGQGRHPPPDAERFAERASRAGVGDGVFVVAYGADGRRRAAVVAAEALRARRLCGADRGLDAWGGEPARGRRGRRPGGVHAARTQRRHDRRGRSPRGEMSHVVDASCAAVARRGQPDRQAVPGRIPGAQRTVERVRPQLPEGETVAYCGSGVTASVLVHRSARRPRRSPLPRLLEPVGDARPAG